MVSVKEIAAFENIKIDISSVQDIDKKLAELEVVNMEVDSMQHLFKISLESKLGEYNNFNMNKFLQVYNKASMRKAKLYDEIVESVMSKELKDEISKYLEIYIMFNSKTIEILPKSSSNSCGC
jgi:hypothetical protein